MYVSVDASNVWGATHNPMIDIAIIYVSIKAVLEKRCDVTYPKVCPSA